MKIIYILIWVHRGFIQEPEIFYSAKDAEKRKNEIETNGFNPDYDELDVFKKLQKNNSPKIFTSKR